MKQFGQLSSLLEQLEQEATLLDNQRGEQQQALFDQKLFRCQSKLLTPYTYEAHETLDKILCEQSSGSLSPDQAEFLSEKLLWQISAIKRELATTALRQSEPTGKSFSQRNLNELYQSLAQHQQWEQRLKTLVKNKEQEHKLATPRDKSLAAQTLQSAQRRLQRCQQAKIKIEKQISYKERNQ
ncbi:MULTISPECIES: primosomal replication protein [Vibrio]|uniref:primosomal replication protein n=1 Tax=Vibrio TaxID=662 RepID=UPI0001B954B9|nr:MULTISPECIES: primosomal replication protein [Vibrio]EEX31576.1 primosomal replication protein N prime prime [Vibrio coralliilyticus ATCC BAA-450]MCM5506758.1 primosomal replication protein [Vibrio sp. SCSIO 43169]MDE3898765.1 primosomal replication protein [Vibrio sp. CC007]QFT36910.1 primosomal replication protein N'' [Vibrio sp. THAF64]QGM34811.1 primosomal replication protein N'' [Vibrio sp. THAF191d]